MAVEYVAIMGHNKSLRQLEQLRRQLNKERFPDVTALRNAIREHNSWQIVVENGGNWEWRPSIDVSLQAEWEQEKSVELEGMGTILFGYKACAFYIYMPSTLFDESLGIRREMRKIWFEFAQRVGSNYAIYVPDNAFPPSAAIFLIDDGFSLDEIRDWLANRGEAGFDPVLSANENETRLEESSEYNYYYIDDFRDLRGHIQNNI